MRKLLLLLALTTAASACLWDRDTLAAERAGLPELYDAILGVYPRHTPEFYRHRIATIEAAGELTEPLYDDLAVALERVGDSDRAIALMREKDARWPDRYTTWANLGTFLAHAGRWDEAAAAVRRALELNPDAHFQRERYQLLAIEQALLRRTDPAAANAVSFLGFDFEQRLGPAFRRTAPSGGEERQRAVARRHVLDRLGLEPNVFDGIVGMLVIAQREPAELYFTLAELLAATGDRNLAWHAYQRALDLDHPRAADIPYYQHQVAGALPREQQDELREPVHYRARRRAVAWVEAYQAYERKLIADGGDPEDPAAYEPFFREHPKP